MWYGGSRDFAASSLFVEILFEKLECQSIVESPTQPSVYTKPFPIVIDKMTRYQDLTKCPVR